MWSLLLALLALCLACFKVEGGRGHHSSDENTRPKVQLHPLMINSTFMPSVLRWNSIEESRRFALTAMTIDHNYEGPWYIPSLHEKHSIGWNRTIENGFNNKPLACTLRFFGIGLESALNGHQYGGSGYVTLHFKNENNKDFWHGFDKNETFKVHCYYMTNKHMGSEFVDTPKTLGIAVACPVTMDLEVGYFQFNEVMRPGYYCRVLADVVSKVEVNLRPTGYDYKSVAPRESIELQAQIETFPASIRRLEQKLAQEADPRPHAVCAVLTFRNEQTGTMLHTFVDYYHRLGWYIIIYDRFGFHREFIERFIGLSGFDYHPYTLFQLAQPSKYNAEYAAKQSFNFKYFYRQEKNWGYTGTGQADTADQDADKTHTYDHARIEYSHLDLILYIDVDEFFYCPQAKGSIHSQRNYQHRIMSTFSLQGIEEMRFVRLPFSGMAPAGFVNTVENRSRTDFTYHTAECMHRVHVEGAKGTPVTVVDYLKCWSSASAYDNFPKSGDLGGKCPFHYNHWSCDGMRNGGRDWGSITPRCRCKVAFDMINGFEYKPLLNKCHILHFNDNKYRFESSKGKHESDRGDVTKHCALVDLFSNKVDGTLSSKYHPNM